MPAITVSDATLLKTILEIEREGTKFTFSDLAERVGMTGEGVSRRVQALADLEAVSVVKGGRRYWVRVQPAAFDLVYRDFGVTRVRWEAWDGVLKLSVVEEDPF